MKKNKVFIACDSTNITKIKKIINKTKNSKIKIGYKFGLEFLNSKNGRHFVSKLKNKIIFGDYKFADIPNPGWEVSRRFRQFVELHDQLLQIYPSRLPELPKKRMRSNNSEVARKRQTKLRIYMHSY